MSPEKASVTVRIAGEEHSIRANAEPEYTKRCAKLVDDRIHEIRQFSVVDKRLLIEVEMSHWLESLDLRSSSASGNFSRDITDSTKVADQ